MYVVYCCMSPIKLFPSLFMKDLLISVPSMESKFNCNIFFLILLEEVLWTFQVFWSMYKLTFSFEFLCYICFLFHILSHSFFGNSYFQILFLASQSICIWSACMAWKHSIQLRKKVNFWEALGEGLLNPTRITTFSQNFWINCFASRNLHMCRTFGVLQMRVD